MYSLAVLFGVVTLVFFLFHVLPGDPARMTMGQRSDQATLENMRRELHLDRPLATRYLLFLNDLSPVRMLPHKDSLEASGLVWARLALSPTRDLALAPPHLGRSYRSKRPVSDLLIEALPGTLLLALSAISLATVVGIFLGTIAALYKGSWLDSAAMILAVAGISLPSFFAGLLIAYGFGFLWHATTGLNMTGTLWEYDLMGVRHLALQNLVLPTLALGVRPLAIITQLTRSSLLQVLHQDYIRTAYAKGLTTRAVIWRHALPNALNPVVTAVSGWLAELLAGSFFIEYIFGWKGIGKLAVDALDRFDFPVVMGSVLLASSIYILINLLTDLLYRAIDPRVRV